MTKIDTQSLELTQATVGCFQHIVDHLASATSADYIAILRASIATYHIEILAKHQSSKIDNKLQTRLPYLIFDSIDSTNSLIEKHRLKGTLTELEQNISYVSDALFWPDGEFFGLIVQARCATYNSVNDSDFSLVCFKESVESHLKACFLQQRLSTVTELLKLRSFGRTKELAQLNFALSQEIARRKAAEQELHFHKTHDIATGFLNQNALIEQVNRLLVQAAQNGEHVVVVHIVFANGRRIQERFGEDHLSELLCQFKQRVGDIDCVETVTGRTSISNIVFAIQAQTLTPFIDNLCYHCLEICHTDFILDKHHIHLHGHIGVSTSIDSARAEDLIYFSNEAAFACKETGQKYCYYSETHTEQRMHTNQIESYLLQAVRHNDLKLFFQPKVDLKTGNWVGAEALIRWNHPVLGKLSNENLIQLAEQNGLIFEVGNFVLRSAIEAAAEWIKGNDNFKIAVNVSSVQLNNADFINNIIHLLESYQFPANRLEVELTESALISDEYAAKVCLSQLHKLGVTLSLDDFGTGCASFSYLKNYPFSSLKIDKSFIQNFSKNGNDMAIVSSIVQVAKKLDLQVTIEGVENIDQERFVLREGCDFAQGYLYGEPMSNADFTRCMNRQ